MSIAFNFPPMEFGGQHLILVSPPRSGETVGSRNSLHSSPPTSGEQNKHGFQHRTAPILRNVFTDKVGSFSSQLPYDTTENQFHHSHNESSIQHVFQPISKRLWLTATNLAFERFDFLQNDLKVLFDYIAKDIIPMHILGTDNIPLLAQGGLVDLNSLVGPIGTITPQPAAPQTPLSHLEAMVETIVEEAPAPKPYIRFIGFTAMDQPLVPNPNEQKKNGYNRGQFNNRLIPAKVRHIEVETNYPFLAELLADPRLFILADHFCFHVCWDGKFVRPQSSVEGSQPVIHQVAFMTQFCNEVWEGSLRNRHRVTEGLPCNTIKFKCWQQFDILED